MRQLAALCSSRSLFSRSRAHFRRALGQLGQLGLLRSEQALGFGEERVGVVNLAFPAARALPPLRLMSAS